jgi:hypothetical protein
LALALPAPAGNRRAHSAGPVQGKSAGAHRTLLSTREIFLVTALTNIRKSTFAAHQSSLLATALRPARSGDRSHERRAQAGTHSERRKADVAAFTIGQKIFLWE